MSNQKQYLTSVTNVAKPDLVANKVGSNADDESDTELLVAFKIESEEQLEMANCYIPTLCVTEWMQSDGSNISTIAERYSNLTVRDQNVPPCPARQSVGITLQEDTTTKRPYRRPLINPPPIRKRKTWKVY